MADGFEFWKYLCVYIISFETLLLVQALKSEYWLD